MENNDRTREESTVGLRIAETIAPIKRTSERVIGITKYEYPCTLLTYNGVTVRPEPITPLERAIVGIIDIDGETSLEKVGKILGLDIEYDNAEKDMLCEAIDKMRGYGMLEGDGFYFSLTEKGKVFAREGERPVTYSNSFTILYDDKHPDCRYLGVDFDTSKLTKRAEVVSPATTLDDIDTIKAFAEVQDPSVQNERNRFILQEATFKSVESIVANIYVVILQSIRGNGECSFFVYDDTQNSILPHVSELIQNDQDLNSCLLQQCINDSLSLSEEDGGWVSVPNEKEKDDAQKAIEAELIRCEDEGKEVEGNDLERLHKKAIYDQDSFEFELDKIFRKDKPDEVWLISPFVSWSFVNVRIKQFEPLLKANKHIFIAYSEPYDDKSTISQGAEQEVMKEMDRLSRTYPNFYCVELPRFHTKQVLEVKDGQCVLFNGSFNVLSFDNVSEKRKVSREEMALVHHQVAISKHQEYVKTFASIYMKRILDEMSRCNNPKDIARIKSDHVDYLRQVSENKDIFVDFYTEYDEKIFLAQNTIWLEECERLVERISQSIEIGSVGSNEYKEMTASYQRLIKEFVSLAISNERISELEDAYTNLKKLLKSKNKAKDASKNNISLPSRMPGSLAEKAKDIIEESDFKNERSVTLYVFAYYFMYVNRAFESPTKSTKYLKKMLDNSMAISTLSLFNYRENKNGKWLDVTIGVGGYLFKLSGIWPIKKETELSTIRIPKSTVRMKNVNQKNVDEIFKTLISE